MFWSHSVGVSLITFSMKYFMTGICTIISLFVFSLVFFKMAFTCDMCEFESDKFVEFRNHVVRRHQHDPNFHVRWCIGTCAFTTRKWNCFRVHIHRKHKNVMLEENHTYNPIDIDDSRDQDRGSDLSYYNTLHYNTLYALTLEAKYNLTQEACKNVVASTCELLNRHDQSLRSSIKAELRKQGIDDTFVNDIPVDTNFNQLLSVSTRERLYEELPTYVKPREVVLRSIFRRRNGRMIEIARKGCIVPFEASLTQLIKMPEAWRYVCHPESSNDGIMRDVIHGDLVQSHPLFTLANPVCVISINCDDLELVNPIGSHTKVHKITVFYYSLLNIPAQYRSTLHSIQLLGIANAKDVKNNSGALLNDFITVMNKLQTTGIEVDVDDTKRDVKGFLAFVAADTPAANWLGQFKECVSFALKNCHMCQISSHNIGSAYTANDPGIVHRSMAEHKERCEYLSSHDLTREAKLYWSKQWGINGSSCLLKLDFDLTTGLVQDPMHVLLEGMVKYEMAMALYYSIHVKKFFTLKWVNTAIKGFRYSYIHLSRKPLPFDKRHLEGPEPVKQTAAAMLTLCEVFPLIIGQKIPEQNDVWINFLRLIHIVLLCTSPFCARSTASILRIFISQYLDSFHRLYPKTAFTPKMHFCIHFPRQMLQYGPLRHHWCMY